MHMPDVTTRVGLWQVLQSSAKSAWVVLTVSAQDGAREASTAGCEAGVSAEADRASDSGGYPSKNVRMKLSLRSGEHEPARARDRIAMGSLQRVMAATPSYSVEPVAGSCPKAYTLTRAGPIWFDTNTR